MKMKLWLAGLPDRDAAVLEAFVGMSWRGATCERLRGERVVSPSTAMRPTSDYCVVDLSGLGMPTWSVAREAQLLALVGGRGAVVMIPAGDGGGWMSASRQCADREPMAWVQKPCTTEAVRAALDQLRAPRQGRLNPAPAVAPSGPAPGCGSGIMPGGIGALVAAFPAIRENAFMRLLTDALAAQRPCELRINNLDAAVFSAERGWVACNVERDALSRLLREEHLVRAILVRQFSEDAAIERAKRLGSRQELDGFMWQLAIDAFGKTRLACARDLSIRLGACPDFARLSGVPGLHLQLAAICQRMPQSLSSLQRLFPRQDPSKIALFFVCAVLSGVARVLPADDAAVLSTSVPAPVQATGASPGRKGLFKALFQKLF